MKLIHLSDLHLGKRVNEFPMIDDQKYILTEIINIIDAETPDAVLIAGDVYDKSQPSAEAVELLDGFLARLAQRKLRVFVISGNHDSPEKVAYGGKIFEKSGVHMSRVYDGKADRVVLEDEYGPVSIYMLPFIKPSNVRRLFPDETVESYTDAVGTAIKHMEVNEAERNVIVTHQFVTGAVRSDSEDVSVGGSDNVDASVFAPFDYTALGHIHKPQKAAGEFVRYCGSPLKYSFSEAKDNKSAVVAELKEKGNVAVRTVPLVPIHDMREIRGTYDEITAKSYYEGTAVDDYLRVILTDEEEILNGMGRLRTIYKNVMELKYDNTRTRSRFENPLTPSGAKKTPLELFEELYKTQNGKPMSEEQIKYCQSLMDEIWGDGE